MSYIGSLTRPLWVQVVLEDDSEEPMRGLFWLPGELEVRLQGLLETAVEL